MTTTCNVKLLTPTAQMPQRGSPLAAGLDVRADLFDADGAPRRLKTSKTTDLPVVRLNEAGLEGQQAWGLYLPPGARLLVPTGIAMATSEDVYTRVAPRSGLALGDGIDVMAGVVDADYAGEVGVMLINHDPEEAFLLHHGMRVAQLVLTMVSLVAPRQVDDLSLTDRGQGGFGSTGLS